MEKTFIIAALVIVGFTSSCTNVAGTSDETEYGVVAGVVRDRYGTGVHDALVTLHWQGAGVENEVTVRSLSDGTFEFERVRPGTYFIETKDLYNDEGSLAQIKVSKNQELDHRVQIRKMGTIQGRFDSAEVRLKKISVVEVFEIQRTAEVHENGVFQLHSLPPYEDGYRLGAYSGHKKVASELDSEFVAVGSGRTVNISNKVDIDDDILVAYHLSKEQTAQFSYKDGKISEFWSEWDDRDSILMVPSRNTYEGRRAFANDKDAVMTVKAAGDAAGLYLYAEITDDEWMDVPTGVEAWIADAVDFYFDPFSSEFNNLNAETRYLKNDKGHRLFCLTENSFQMQVWMGAGVAPEMFRLSAVPEGGGGWESASLSFDAARITAGLAFEVVQESPTRKAQEWFIPWSKIGFGREPVVGTRMAFSGGYNDIDKEKNLVASMVKSLRWKEKDPFAPADSNGEFPDSWGDIEMGIGFPNE